jgi:hypothetical protein
MQSAIATFFGNKAGALTGKIIDVSAPGMNGLQKFTLEQGVNAGTSKIVDNMFNRGSR